MARKDLLKGLMETATSPAPPSDTSEPRVDAARPRYSKGAIGAVSQSIAELKSRAIVEVDPRMIDGAGLTDRIEEDAEGHAALVASIREYGQQVPVLLRPNPNDPERYEVVYGRRRIAALRELNQPVKALVRVLDDRALVMAQGQENSARRDLTFIEKVNFAKQMDDGGYDRKAICDALHVDKTVISRMLTVAAAVPVALVEAIGAAPSVGRNRWLDLAEMLKADGAVDKAIALAVGDTSDARFDAVLTGLAKAPLRPAATRRNHVPEPLHIDDETGLTFARAKKTAAGVTIMLDSKTSGGFEDWLLENLHRLHRDWKQRDEE